ncbi:hypothetical protein LINPERHAP2_LOCUS29309 [Linum perenne]
MNPSFYFHASYVPSISMVDPSFKHVRVLDPPLVFKDCCMVLSYSSKDYVGR